MQIIECIHFRAAGGSGWQQAECLVQQFAAAEAGTARQVQVFRDLTVTGDLWIQLQPGGLNASRQTSPTAQALLHELRRYGQTHYTQWTALSEEGTCAGRPHDAGGRK